MMAGLNSALWLFVPSFNLVAFLGLFVCAIELALVDRAVVAPVFDDRSKNGILCVCH